MKKDILDKRKQKLKDFIKLKIWLLNKQKEIAKHEAELKYEEKLFLLVISIISINLFILAVAFNL